MDDLQAAFLADVPRRIRNLRENLEQLHLNSNEPELVRKLFRQLHTFKGSSAAFGFEQASRIAHELENLVEIINPENLNQTIAALNDGIGEIEAAFSGADSADDNSRKFQNWQAIYQNARQNKVETDEPEALPFDLEKQLSPGEVQNLRKSLKQHSALAVISAKFTPANFGVDFYALQSRLKSAGETVATLPDAANTSAAEIGLRLIFVCNSDEESLKEILPESGAEIANFFQKRSSENSNDRAKIKLSNLCRAALLAGQKTAEAQGKTVVFKTLGIADAELEPIHAEACEIALLHITRNAVAHGIEPAAERIAVGKNENGEIRLEAWRESETLCLQISDDGRGLEIEKIRRHAARQNLIGEDKLFNDADAKQMIFLSGFSTAEKVTGEAGRGVGLDAVKSAVSEAGGSVEVSTEAARGTRFLIRFPLKLENQNNQTSVLDEGIEPQRR